VKRIKWGRQIIYPDYQYTTKFSAFHPFVYLPPKKLLFKKAITGIYNLIN